MHLHTPLLSLPVHVLHCDVWQLKSVAFYQLRRPVRTRPTYHRTLHLPECTTSRLSETGRKLALFVSVPSGLCCYVIRMQDVLGLHDKGRHSNIGSCLCITISRKPLKTVLSNKPIILRSVFLWGFTYVNTY
jgi:hypothetical protein